ncbi:Biotin carboxylase [Galdieria sulphuraria]|uniref:Biotin carboxylase n=1 Tax=Galdieria sulphuraria TaxID=130081 RepID=M2Y7T2_GALSU|nr:bifunctional acetyl-CoA carboxylase / biotin carboxylase subunit isoform 1 [Galdieria sulphuraria]EME31879.1 bifunctional acetyl-CoA carboxylase / biotin carboxylase subunit isoform 1 [Galdieria sulphuraria]GJD10382.1 Biotin carboxylase [Galdieria sulphuraria]|eukprot:XP_005708399.1 bifunctional acetyl-CoA carboxylase / biotin carboxylase subunit isoform 1 [Galdieria sulphuraria]
MTCFTFVETFSLKVRKSNLSAFRNSFVHRFKVLPYKETCRNAFSSWRLEYGSQSNFSVPSTSLATEQHIVSSSSSALKEKLVEKGQKYKVKPIKKVLVANRGEIAVRIIRSCREMGIETVAIYSTADRNALHVALADETVCIGEPSSKKSYLDITSVLAAAEITGADAVHPGYGFLSENSVFSSSCEEMGVTFIGPSPFAIDKMGDKSTAKETMLNAGVPCVPGSNGILSDAEEAVRIAENIGYPVLLKATAGGGGRGIKLARNSEELRSLYQMCSAEAQAAFGNGKLYLEKFVEAPRHVEIQVFADKYGNAIHLGERDCSIQRRNQKLVEEAPCPVMTEELRAKMGEAAVNAAKAINYCGAGTVEFLLSAAGEFYFMEMNTRIQVEHPITEQITGIDIVQLQLQIAEGRPLPYRQSDINLKGHAIEVRVNCEEPKDNFRPVPGQVSSLFVPGGLGIRWDSHIYPGYTIAPNYDSMIGKLIVWGPTRDQAIRKMKRALNEMNIVGVPSTIPLHRAIFNNEKFIQGKEIYTNFIETEDILSQVVG